MFCTECGADGVTGKFCASCGTPTNPAASMAVANQPSLVFGAATIASKTVIDICEPRWASGFEDEDGLSAAHFATFTNGDWGTLANYLNEKAAYPFGGKYYSEFLETYTDTNKPPHSLEFSEYLDGVVSEYIAQLDPAKDQLKLLIAAGFLANLPYPADWNGSGFWIQKTENILKELEIIFDVLRIGEADSLVGQNLDEILDVLTYLSDFGLSALIPHLGETPKQKRYLRAMVRPLDRSPAISMASLMYFNTSAGKSEDLSQTLISPRTIHLLFDESNLISPWWREFALWETGGLASCWKDYLPESATSDRDWGKERVITLLRNSLNEDLYSNKAVYQNFMQDRDMFEGLLNFLES